MKKITNKLIIGAISLATVSTMVTSCSKDDNTPIITPPPVDTTVVIQPLGGYTSSDSVAAANLIAYWPFEGNANDVKGGQTANAVRVTYTAGLRGQAWQGGDSVYATVPASSAFNSLPSYSYSMWYKIPAQPVSGDPAGMFFLKGTTNSNLMIYELESFSPLSGDSVKVHHGFNDLASPAYQLFVMETYDTMAINTWVHLVTTYNAATSTYIVYENGIPTGNNSAFGQNVTPTQMWTDGSQTTPLGPLGFNGDAPTQVILGTWPAGLFGVSPTLGSNGDFLGQMDEIRVFNKALTSAEVIGLYLNGKAGR